MLPQQHITTNEHQPRKSSPRRWTRALADLSRSPDTLGCSAVHELRFSCIPGCTKCCDTEGFVYLSEADLVRAAEFVGMTPADFEAKFVYRTRTLLRLRKPRRKQCPFLLDGGCGIHPAKPTQCRLYPFWPELVENRAGWRAASRTCPGIGTGQLIQIGTAVETAHEMRTAYPGLYAHENAARKKPKPASLNGNVR